MARTLRGQHVSMIWIFFTVVSTYFQYVSSQNSGRPQQPLQPLGDVLMLVLDKDKNQKVTMDEVNSQLKMLERLFENGEEGNEYLAMLHGVQKVAPQMFELLDMNSDKNLAKKELAYITKFEKSLGKGGGFREFLRASFKIIDTNGDDQLSVDELVAAVPSSNDDNSSALSSMAVEFHKLFPLRKTAKELEDFLRYALGGKTDNIGAKVVSDNMFWIDYDGDGMIQRNEVGKAYKTWGSKFLEISKTIRTMGPMLALLGGDMGGGGMKMEF
mmetsp:Transcript_28341/g.41166  ORF Transcript_28341/g.41166 Transcript_28341/m.41166 type:complete len:271 (-) Transcript_28341:161-973(-)